MGDLLFQLSPRKGHDERNIMLLVKELHAVYDVLNDESWITGEMGLGRDVHSLTRKFGRQTASPSLSKLSSPHRMRRTWKFHTEASRTAFCFISVSCKCRNSYCAMPGAVGQLCVMTESPECALPPINILVREYSVIDGSPCIAASGLFEASF